MTDSLVFNPVWKTYYNLSIMYLTRVSGRCCGYVQILLLKYYKLANFLKIFFLLVIFTKTFIIWSWK